jgi:hypothetical protein
MFLAKVETRNESSAEAEIVPLDGAFVAAFPPDGRMVVLDLADVAPGDVVLVDDRPKSGFRNSDGTLGMAAEYLIARPPPGATPLRARPTRLVVATVIGSLPFLRMASHDERALYNGIASTLHIEENGAIDLRRVPGWFSFVDGNSMKPVRTYFEPSGGTSHDRVFRRHESLRDAFTGSPFVDRVVGTSIRHADGYLLYTSFVERNDALPLLTLLGHVRARKEPLDVDTAVHILSCLVGGILHLDDKLPPSLVQKAILTASIGTDGSVRLGFPVDPPGHDRVRVRGPSEIPFWPPELLLGQPAVSSSIFFTLGAVAYVLLSGHDLHEATTELEVARHTVNQAPIAPLASIAPHVPIELAALVDQALRHAPEQRVQDAVSFLFGLPPSTATQVTAVKVLVDDVGKKDIEAEREVLDVARTLVDGISQVVWRSLISRPGGRAFQPRP